MRPNVLFEKERARAASKKSEHRLWIFAFAIQQSENAFAKTIEAHTCAK
jgi:hypothetical protein